MNLDDIRVQIDLIDRELLSLLSQRADLVHEVGVVKKRDGLQIYAPEREQALLDRLVTMNEGRLPEKSIKAIYREIMSAALALEDDLKIAYLGPEGTWTHQASIKKFGHSVTHSPQPNISDVFDQVARRRSSYGIVPIENSTDGAVFHTLDLFVDSPLHICAQILLRIEHSLMAAIPREEIRTLYSHPQALGQCRAWISKNFPNAELVEVSSTTKAAEIARDQAHSGAAAIGSPLAAELYKLNVLDESIQDRATNTTRFLVIGEKTCPATGNDRTSILFAINDRPGSLVNALQAFEHLHINLSKIESRPSKRKDWEYIFHVDLNGHSSDENVVAALAELALHCSMVKVLGSYPDTCE